MERFSPPATSLRKRISPPIAWNLGLTSEDPRIVKVILLGHQGVGKTALAVRFATKRYIGGVRLFYREGLQSGQFPGCGVGDNRSPRIPTTSVRTEITVGRCYRSRLLGVGSCQLRRNISSSISSITREEN